MSELHVVFGTGPLGQATMRALIKRGRQVRMVNRSGKAESPVGVELVAGDAYNPEFTRQVTQGVAVVYQCAQPGYTKWVKEFPPLQASILEGAAASHSKLIVAENLYMYGEVKGPISEDLPYTAETRKGKVRAEMASALLEAHRIGKVRVAMARGSDFYGPGVLGSALGERTLIPALKGKSAELGGSLDIPHSYTYIEDFGQAMAILGEREEALGQVWHVPNQPTVTQRELMTLFFKEIGLPPKMHSMGRLMMSIGGLFVPEAKEMVEMMYEFEKPFVVDSSKFILAFGDISTPQQEAIRATIAWYRDYLKQLPA
jgi:nucleoside-diphosphate-sugar epimerase